MHRLYAMNSGRNGKLRVKVMAKPSRTAVNDRRLAQILSESNLENLFSTSIGALEGSFESQFLGLIGCVGD